MKLPWMMVVVLAAGCGDKQAAGTGSGSAVAVTTTPSSDLPSRKAPATPEVLAQFDHACDAGTASACFDAGIRRANGMGTTRDRVAAVSWLEKGCKLDELESCALLSGFLATGDEGVPVNLKRSFELDQKGCPKRPASCSSLAIFYASGDIVPKDLARALKLLQQGCDGGDPRGCENVATHLASGDLGTKDPAWAAADAKKACDLSQRNCETLGAFYIGGTGVAKDVDKGVSLVDKACNAGSKQACDGLATLRGN